jgi:GGDEF domain-containing protein
MDATAYGHMAGCALMQRLGLSAAEWFATLDTAFGCVSTFGGDEIIVTLPVEEGEDDAFEAMITDLRNELYNTLPRSVSFGWTVGHLNRDDTGQVGRQHYRSRSINLISAVDQALFRQKSVLRGAGLPCGGFVMKARAT